MHPHYPSFYKNTQTLAAFEKAASHLEGEFAPEVAEKTAAVCSEFFEDVVARATARSLYAVKTAAVIDYLCSMRESHVGTGEKVAAETDVGSLLMKIAVCVAVDDVLTAQMAGSDAELRKTASAARALGREWFSELAKSVLR